MEKAAVLSKTECKMTLIEVVLGRKIVNFQHLVVNGRRDVVESFRLNCTIHFNNPNCDTLFIAQLFTLCFIIFFNL